MEQFTRKKPAYRYRLDRGIRSLAMKILNWIVPAASDHGLDVQPQKIQRILIVRSLFRMGDSILATPAILMFRKNFPAAKIDFVGSSVSKALFENMPIDRHYEIDRSFPRSSWSYLVLLRKIRKAKYDLAFEASGSSAAMGSFIVGFSAARLRIGVKGRWDRWFNVRLDRPSTNNKYRALAELIGALGLERRSTYPRLFLSPSEIKQGHSGMQVLTGSAKAPVVGIFVGGRKSRGKRWPKENFFALARQLLDLGAQPVIFVGPEERELLSYFKGELKNDAPTIFEPNIRAFAALVAHCRLFVACDSGPVHLACALRVRTVAIFLKNDFDRWGPPLDLGQIVHNEGSVSVDAVAEACRLEVGCASAAASGGGLR